MNKLLMPMITLFAAGLGVSHAADEKPPGTSTPALQPMHVDRPVSPTRPLPEAKPLGDAEATALKTVGTKIFGIKWGSKTVAVADRGFQVVTDGVATLSYRPAGNAYFLQRKGKVHAFEDRGFQGSDDALRARGTGLLAGLGIDKLEIAELRILRQFVTTGSTDPASGRMTIAKPQSDRRSLVAARAIEGIPVWNSRLKLDLNEKGEIAALELSWPKIDPKVMEVARRMKTMTAFKAPERAGAKVESVEAGILHSPAASFVDDQAAAIRVIYAPSDSRLGMKPLIYLDADGRPVPTPRQLESAPEAPTPPRAQK